MILDDQGNPYPVATGKVAKQKVTKSHGASTTFSDIGSWLRSGGQTPEFKAQNPLNHHAWVYAAAQVTSIVSSQAPFLVFRETEEVEEARRQRSLKHYGSYTGAKRGSGRRAVQRHLQATNRKSHFASDLEEDLEHPVYATLLRPNPHQDIVQLFQVTNMFLSILGECFWVLEAEDGGSVAPGDSPARIWPLSPRLFEPIFSDGTMGELVGWRYRPPEFTLARLKGITLDLPLTDVVQFKFPNPNYPIRGLSRLSAMIQSVETDLLAAEYNKSVIQNGGDPGGIITYDSTLTKEEETEYLEAIEQRHQGASNALKTMILSGGFNYTPVAMSQKDMEYLETRKYNREEILAVMLVPPSVLGITEFTNYATQLGQDQNFWDKNIIPTQTMIESTLDATLFFNEPDNVIGAFDRRDIEALRSGITEKVMIASQLSAPTLHVPPRAAFAVVGLEVPPYEDDDIVVGTFGQTELDLSGDDPFDMEDDEDEDDDVEEEETEDEEIDEEEDDDELEEDESVLLSKTLSKSHQRAQDFLEVQSVQENRMKKLYRSWILGEKREALALFDDVTKSINFQAVLKQSEFVLELPGLIQEMRDRLKAKTRPRYTDALETTYQFTLGDVGVPVFDIDNEVLVDYFDLREQKFLDTVPSTVIKNLTNSLEAGIIEGETVQQLRKRVAQVFDVSASSSKSLQVARTETANFMNGVRDRMFTLQGITKQEWVTAGDEVVRGTHELYGNSGAHETGFDYLSLGPNAGQGSLRHPGDLDAPASEVINCRCVMIPVE